MLADWWNGTIEKGTQWSFYQALLGINVFIVLSYTFDSTILDMYSPDAATLFASGSSGVVALIFLMCTHFARLHPIKVSTSLVYQLFIIVIAPAVMLSGQRAPLSVLVMAVVNMLLAAAAWRRPARRKTFDDTVSPDELEAYGVRNAANATVTRGTLVLLAWEVERQCLLWIGLGYFSSGLHHISEPVLLIIMTAVLFVWLNAPSLLPPGVLTQALVLFLGRLFHVVGAFNIEYFVSTFWARDRIATMHSLDDMMFWMPVLVSASVMGSIILGKEGLPQQAIEQFIDDDRRWKWIWRSCLLAALVTLIRCIYFWAFDIIPLLRLMS